MIVDARSLPPGETVEADIAIAGAGAAGIALALALAGKGRRIVLIETGGEGFDAAAQDRAKGELGEQTYAALDAARLMQLGGSTMHWGGWSREFDALDFENRADMGKPGWPIGRSDLEPFYAEARRLLEIDEAGHRAPETLAARMGAGVPFAGGAVEPVLFDMSPPTRMGTRWREALAQADGVTVLLHATVADLLLDASRTAVVELPLVTGAGTELRLVARHTVLACGGIGNAQMLLNADSQMPGGLGNAHDQVGRYFSDHPILIGYAGLMTTRPEAAAAFASADAIDGSRRYRLALQPSQALRRERGLLNTLITLEGTDMLFDGRGFAGWSEGFIGPKAAAEAVARVQGREVLSVHPLNAGLETRPGPESRVLLTGERDAAGLRRVKLDWRLRQADLDLWLATMDVVAGEALAGGWGIVWVDPRAKDRFPKDIAWGHHHIGTTRMGADPKSSVCDADARVHGVSNLWVAGSSLFTSPGACNPTLNLVALALRLAKTLEARA